MSRESARLHWAGGAAAVVLLLRPEAAYCAQVGKDCRAYLAADGGRVVVPLAFSPCVRPDAGKRIAGSP